MKILYAAPFLMALPSAFASADIMWEDFESGSYAPKWTVEGEAFGTSPAKGGFPYQNKVSGYNGDFLVNSYFNRDDTTGKITSAPFRIERKFLTALVGGGRNAESLYMRVLVGGREAGRLTGRNDERLELRGIDLRAWQGRTGVIEIVDNAKGGWGHINVDDIVFTDNPPRDLMFETLSNLEKSKRYVSIPINNSAPQRRVKISDPDGKTVLLDENIPVDFKNPQWTYSMETRELEGGPLRIETQGIAGETPKFETTDEYWAGEYPNELLRPQYHFSSPQGWLNDPNGLVHWQGRWHMYYQLTPFRVMFSNLKYWGHAVSDDLIAWKHLPVAITPFYRPDGGENSIWSGTAFADVKNRSGFFGKKGGLIFAYTVNGRGDYAGWSADGSGVNMIEPPISTAKGRDPCIFYHEASGKWVVLRYEEVKNADTGKGERKFVFYSSKDFKSWQRGQVLDDFYECPYMTAMPVNGDSSNMKYLIFDARGECVVGDFDGETFTAIGGRRPKFLLGDAYAGQVFHNAPGGRVVNISWFRQHAEDFKNSGMPFSQMMSLPVELELTEKGGEYRIRAKAVPEIEKFYGVEKRSENVKIDGPQDFGTLTSSSMIEAEIDLSGAESVKIDLGRAFIEYVKKDNAYHVRPKPPEGRSPKTRAFSWGSMHYKMDGPAGDILKFKVFIDRGSLEIFHCGGQVIAQRMPFGDDRLAVSVSGKGAVVKGLVLREMKPAFSKDSLNGL